MSGEVGEHLDRLSQEWEEVSRPVFERDFPEAAKKAREMKQRKEQNIASHGGDMRSFYRDPAVEK